MNVRCAWASWPALLIAAFAVDAAELQPSRFKETVRDNKLIHAPYVVRGLQYVSGSGPVHLDRLAVVVPPAFKGLLCLRIESRDGHYFAEAEFSLDDTAGRHTLGLRSQHASVVKRYPARHLAVAGYLAKRCEFPDRPLLLPVHTGDAREEHRLLLIVNNGPDVESEVRTAANQYLPCALDESADRRRIAFDTECELVLPPGPAKGSFTLVRSEGGHDLPPPIVFDVYVP